MSYSNASGICDVILDSIDMRAIAAMAANRVIGKNNSLPWAIPEEMKFFHQTTSDASVLMGRKTFESIGHPLANRHNIVITSDPAWKHDGVTVIHDIEQLLKLPVPLPIWLCGGATLYRELLPACRELFLSEISHDYDGDATFPDFHEHFIEKEVVFSCSLFKVLHLVNAKFVGGKHASGEKN